MLRRQCRRAGRVSERGRHQNAGKANDRDCPRAGVSGSERERCPERQHHAEDVCLPRDRQRPIETLAEQTRQR